LRDRWSAVMKPPPPLRHSRGRAYELLVSPVWTYIFENYDAGVTGVPLEVRHPLIDLRIVRFALSLPPVPACVDKWLMREATRGVLPESVRLRPKSPLAQDPVEARIRRGTDPVAIAPVEGIGEYVNTHAVRALYIGQNAAVTWARLRPHALNRYLHNHREGPAFSVL
jgi:asparagine synthase (glutamine-hydrolysing)